jgi:hypothetical protein
VLLYTRSFSRALTPAQVERVHEEVAEFYDFYQTHGAGKVDFDFSLLQIDRELRRAEVSEVAPGKYYLSRENVESELVARLGDPARGGPKFDEVIALYAWNNANPDNAQLAYGGGAVGPDGRFFGDAGFNSIGLFAWDVERVGQILIHEVLHNLDDMFGRSGMPDGFFNSDEMSRNMPRLSPSAPAHSSLASRMWRCSPTPSGSGQGRVLPLGDAARLLWWMLERTPKTSWDALKFGVNVAARAADATTIRPSIARSGYRRRTTPCSFPRSARAAASRYAAHARR